MTLSTYVKIHNLELIVLYSMWIYVFLLNISFIEQFLIIEIWASNNNNKNIFSLSGYIFF